MHTYMHKAAEKLQVLYSGPGEYNRRAQSNKLYCKSIELPRTLKNSKRVLVIQRGYDILMI